MKVKMCGITNLEDALLCARQGADALGFIFTKKSPRYIRERDAAKIIKAVGPFTATVGVFLDQDASTVKGIARRLSLDVLQFHGKETPAYCHAFAKEYKVIKVFFPGQQALPKAVASYTVDAIMVDIPYEAKQKAKKQLSSQVLGEIRLLIKEGKRVIVSGGLTPASLSAVKKLSPYAVDVSSGIEQFVGKKDKKLVQAFIRKVCS